MQTLLEIYPEVENIEIKREVVSSIGKQNNNQKILDFIKNNVYNCGFMDLVYQMYRACLYKGCTDGNFKNFSEEIKKFFDNEVLNKMHDYFFYKQNYSGKIFRVKKIFQADFVALDSSNCWYIASTANKNHPAVFGVNLKFMRPYTMAFSEFKNFDINSMKLFLQQIF